MKLAGLVLMGGKNSRMKGREKAFFLYQGKPFYQWAADSMKDLVDVHLSIAWNVDGRAANYASLPYPVIRDIYQEIGPMGGIMSAFAQINTDSLLVLPCDMPGVHENLVKALMKHWLKTGHSVFVKEESGKVHPLAGIYTRECLGVMQCLADQGSYRLMDVLDQIKYHCVTYSSIKAGEYPQGLDGEICLKMENINTEEELHILESRRRRVFAVSGVKNSGKTTLIEKLIPLFINRGCCVAVIKHDGHEFEPDVPGTDSYRHKRAGAYGSAVFSNSRFMVVKEEKINEMALVQHFPEADVIILEGMKDSLYPKLEILERTGDKHPVCKAETVIAYVSEFADGYRWLPGCEVNTHEGVFKKRSHVPCFHLNDAQAIAEYLWEVL